ncbi:MAG: hypothetical protein JWP91_1840 [Fibrobacteres bacterium]|nr:hypothetical protein [Fibrobacterota bacterium]
MKYKAIVLLVISLMSFTLFSIISCNSSDDSLHVLNMRIDNDNDSLLHFDSLIIKVYSKDSSFSQEVFHGKLTDPKQVLGLPLDERVGNEFNVSIIGYKGDKVGVQKEVNILGQNNFQSKDVPIKPEGNITPLLPEIVVTKDTVISEGDSLRLPILIRNPIAIGAFLVLKSGPIGSNLDTIGASTGSGTFAWKPSFTQGRTEPYSVSIEYGTTSKKFEKSFYVTVHNVNRSPKMNRIPNIAKNENEVIEFFIEASDPDGDSVVISLDSLPKNANFSKSHFSWRPGTEFVGNHFLMFRASDGSLSDSQSVILSVGAVNRPPEIVGALDTTVREYDSLNLALLAVDPEGNDITIRATGLPDSAKFLTAGLPAGSAKLIWKIQGNQSRSEPYLVSVFSSDGLVEVKSTVRITVLDVPKKIQVKITSPVADFITNQKVVEIKWTVNGSAQPSTIDSLKIEGSNTIVRTFNDGEGNAGSASITIYRDTESPGMPVLSGSPYSKGMPTFSWNQVEPGISYEYRLIRTGNQTPVSEGSTTSLAFPPSGIGAFTLSNGEHQFYVKAKDRAGNVGAEANYRVLIDLSNPSVALLTPSEMGRTTSIDPIISGTASDNFGLKSFTYSLQDSSAKPLSLINGKWSLEGQKFSEGATKVSIVAMDSAGRDSTISITITKLSKIVFVREGATGSGTSWDNALPDLDIALNSAYLSKYLSGTQIWVTAGNYPRSTSYSLHMKSDLSIIGGFSKSRPQSTLLARDSSDGRSFFYTPQPTSVSELLTVAENDQDLGQLKNASNITFDRLDFMSTDGNGVMIPGASNVIFKNCNFKNAPNSFVIVAIDSSSVEFQNCSFTGNKSLRPISIDNKSQSVTFNNCLFQDNASFNAGAIQVLSGNVLIQNSIFRNNFISTWVGDAQVMSLRHIAVSFSIYPYSLKNCSIQGLTGNPSSITDADGNKVPVDVSNKESN